MTSQQKGQRFASDAEASLAMGDNAAATASALLAIYHQLAWGLDVEPVAPGKIGIPVEIVDVVNVNT